jgi:hypothetical protein
MEYLVRDMGGCFVMDAPGKDRPASSFEIGGGKPMGELTHNGFLDMVDK